VLESKTEEIIPTRAPPNTETSTKRVIVFCRFSFSAVLVSSASILPSLKRRGLVQQNCTMAQSDTLDEYDFWKAHRVSREISKLDEMQFLRNVIIFGRENYYEKLFSYIAFYTLYILYTK
jgi:hypothetical protein